MAVAIKVQNIYGDYLRSFKIFLDKVTRNSLTKLEWDFGAKTLEYHYMMNGHESFEYPTALISIDDIVIEDGVSPIARTAGMNVMPSPHQVIIAENFTRSEQVTLDKRWVTLMTTVTINVEDVSSMLNFYDLFIGYMPLRYFFYDYKFYTYIEVTPFVEHWNFGTDDINNVSIRGSDIPHDASDVHIDPTFRYEPNTYYKEANPDPHFTTTSRDRAAGKDMYTHLEGYRYFSTVQMEPIMKLQSIQKQSDKETQKHSINLNFEIQIEIPNLLIGEIYQIIKTIELVIDPTCTIGLAHEYPLLTDMDDKFLMNKNISGGVILQDIDFHLSDPSYLEVKVDININRFSVSLWAVEDVTAAQASRHFIPLDHAKVVRNVDEQGNFESLHFMFTELEWFRTFDFDNNFNYLKLILFEEGARLNQCIT